MELEKLIIDNKNLIYSIANMYKGYASIEDLFQAGCIGIMKAYEKYNPSFNTKFTSFAYRYILGEISLCANNNKPITISREITSLSSKLDKASDILTQELGKEASPEELAHYLDKDILDVYEAINSNNCVDSLDYTLTSDGKVDMYNIISNNMDIDTMVAIQTELEKLDPIERQIILSHYLYDLSQQEIAKQVGMNQVAVSRCEHKVITKLRKSLIC